MNNNLFSDILAAILDKLIAPVALIGCFIVAPLAVEYLANILL